MAPIVIKQKSTGNIFTDEYFLRNGNSCAGQYCIRGLCSLLSSNGKVEVPDEVARDLKSYKRFREEKKKVWVGRGTRESKLEQTKTLWLEIGSY
jgi:hypothetical protein